MDEKGSAFSGFLQESPEGGWILCDAPDLKSCCLTAHTVVALEGDFSHYKKDAVLSVQGVLHEGVLRDVHVEGQEGSFPYWSLGAVVLAVCLWRGLILTNRKK